MSKTTNKFSPEVRARAVRMVLDHEGEHPSRWAAALSISAKICCSAHTLLDWVKRAEVDSLNNLAFLLHDQGDLAGARPLFDRALEIAEKALGPDHPNTATSLSNLARLLHAQGEFEGARSLFVRALAVGDKALGPEHALTARFRSHFARLLLAAAGPDAARIAAEAALAAHEAALGPAHAWTLDSARVMAEAWNRPGRTEEAAALKARLGLA